MKKYHRINDLQLNAYGCRYEIVKWQTDSKGRSTCYTIAYWSGNDLMFVGDRPFNNKINKKDFWKLAKKGQKYRE